MILIGAIQHMEINVTMPVAEANLVVMAKIASVNLEEPAFGGTILATDFVFS